MVIGFAPGGQADVVQGHLGYRTRSWFRLLQLSFPGGKGDGDLSRLNEFVLQAPFLIETVASSLLYVQEGDFPTSINLNDAYFLNSGHQESRKLLWFLSGGVVYHFEALCFGLSTAPQVFTRVFFAEVSAWALSHRIPLLGYLDD